MNNNMRINQGNRSLRTVRVGVATAVVGALLATGLSASQVASQTTVPVVAPDVCGMCVLDPSGTTLTLNGGAATEVKVTGGGIHVRSAAANGAVLNGSTKLRADGQLRFGGGYTVNGPAAGRLTGTVVTNAGPGADPYAGRVAVETSGVNVSVVDFSGSTNPPVRADGAYRNVSLNGAGTVVMPVGHAYRDVTVNGSIKATLQPGVYRSLTVAGNSTVVLNAGRYVVWGSVTLNGSVKVTGTDAVLVLACAAAAGSRPCSNAGETGAGFVGNGAAALMLAGSAGVASIVADANNKATIDLNGSFALSLAASGVDARSARVNLNGTAKITAGAPVVVGNATLNGSANINVTVPRPLDPNRDTDTDGVPDETERLYGSDVTKADTDADGLNDRFEIEYGGPYLLTTSPDSDGDGTPDAQEDEDGDGATSIVEQANGSDPLQPDGDADGLSDAVELARHTNPLVADSDGDGLDDGAEVRANTNPLTPDSDGDGVNDGLDVVAGRVVHGSVAVTVRGVGDIAGSTSVVVHDWPRQVGQVSDIVDVVVADDKLRSALQSADLTFAYDPAAIANPSDLRVFTQDAETGAWLPVQGAQAVDLSAHTVTAVTPHLSPYGLFDLSAWLARVRRLGSNCAPGLPGPANRALDLVFAVDASGSMSDSDPTGLTKLGL
jgi:hypothetical protein